MWSSSTANQSSPFPPHYFSSTLQHVVAVKGTRKYAVSFCYSSMLWWGCPKRACLASSRAPAVPCPLLRQSIKQQHWQCQPPRLTKLGCSVQRQERAAEKSGSRKLETAGSGGPCATVSLPPGLLTAFHCIAHPRGGAVHLATLQGSSWERSTPCHGKPAGLHTQAAHAEQSMDQPLAVGHHHQALAI